MRPLDGYAARLASPALATHLRGYLTGSLDLVLRTRQGAGMPRLPGRRLQDQLAGSRRRGLCAWHYRPDALAAEMQRDHYPLQALLYLVALHRYLRWRMPGYDPEDHLGGVLYLFLRGMSGPRRPVAGGLPCGVFSWRPPRRWSSPCRTCSTRDRSRPDADDSRLARRTATTSDVPLSAAGILAAFNRAGVLSAADVHVARRLAQLGAEADESVTLAAALAVRAPRARTRVRRPRGRRAVPRPTRMTSSTWATCPGPTPATGSPCWPHSGMVTAGENGPDDRPLRLIGTRPVPRPLLAGRTGRGGCPPRPGRRQRLRSTRPCWPLDGPSLFRRCRRTRDGRPPLPSSRRLCVIAGGPGSGKTTTLARVVALLAEQADDLGGRRPLVGLAAPTGKAAARLEEAVHAEALQLNVAAPLRRHLLSLRASTLHRLLGVRPDSASRFRHHRHHRLPHDVIIVDETSMVALSLMARLIDAVRPDARLILVGDPQQLASVEAGAVLGDIVGPALDRPG